MKEKCPEIDFDNSSFAKYGLWYKIYTVVLSEPSPKNW